MLESKDGSRLFPPALPHRLESMRGPGYTNWVIKRHLLCGPHPGATSTADMVKNLSGLLREGVTAFVSLQEEMPSPMVTASVKASTLPSKRAQASFGNRNALSARAYIDDAQVRARCWARRAGSSPVGAARRARADRH